AEHPRGNGESRRPHAPQGSARPQDGWTRERLVVEQVGVLRDLANPVATSFEARPGEIVAVGGPTGSGKSTLVRALLGLEPASFGTIRYGSRDLSHEGVGPMCRPFAWVPQDAPVIPGTLAHNIALGSGSSSRVRDVLAWIGAERLASLRD